MSLFSGRKVCQMGQVRITREQMPKIYFQSYGTETEQRRNRDETEMEQSEFDELSSRFLLFKSNLSFFQQNVCANSFVNWKTMEIFRISVPFKVS